MSLPTKTDLQTMDLVYKGRPFVYITLASTVDTTTLDYPYLGKPVFTVTDPAVATYNTTQMFAIF